MGKDWTSCQHIFTFFRLSFTHDFCRPLIPRNGFDTHVHVFDPRLAQYAARRAYTPEDAPLENLVAFNQSISSNPQSNSLVLVQPSPYKNDCSAMIHCMHQLKAQNVQVFGIVVLDLNTTSDEQLKEMHELGVRGVRLNFQADGKEVNTDKLVAALNETAERIRHLPGWMIQLFVPGWAWDQLHDPIIRLPVTIIADHLGGMRGSSKLPSLLQSVPTSQPGFKSLLSLARKSRVAVKISGLYRMSSDTPVHDDLQPIVQAFSREIPNQLIWGSDWPHTGEGSNRLEGRIDIKEPFRVVDNHGILGRLHDWMGSEVYIKMMTDNPKRLFH
ncbi:unnamed protein product [Penicillium salamii]|uniref:Amidohydrolase-related domain-containing protein n=1 Tax=Penicillium salamii TaxID=1612424 RepID=A0A9W4J4C4_9EURO|nr:unnamed protein product [Penicillium salamii]CAG8012221.1 unnamed protein product [Penicillium salamii]CAG8019959.1 unnamed protein product [Penicillium salamii]CAG8121725.1 unnamed protein product [Penicillium salamii]CAG8152407.1 unnamed protein product [Penicillium salamii]